MQNNIRNMLAVSCGYAAAVIGAGFASGQEILSFFVKYGKYGFIGIVISCAFFAFFAYAVMSACIERGIDSYSVFLNMSFKSAVMRTASQLVVFLCSGASLCVMIACMGEVAYLTAGITPVIGSALFSAVLLTIFFLNARKIMGINSFLGVVIISGIIFVCYYILRFREHQTFSTGANAAISGFAYAGYNLIGTGALLVYMSRFLESKTEAAISSLAAAMALFVMITLIWAVLGIYYGKINLGEIPMLTMALRQNHMIGAFYSAMLAAAVLTTGISNGFALIDILNRKIPRRMAAVVILAAAFCASGTGFSNLVNHVYRICGYLGAVIAIIIMIKAFKKVKNEEKQRK